MKCVFLSDADVLGQCKYVHFVFSTELINIKDQSERKYCIRFALENCRLLIFADVTLYSFDIF